MTPQYTLSMFLVPFLIFTAPSALALPQAGAGQKGCVKRIKDTDLAPVAMVEGKPLEGADLCAVEAAIDFIEDWIDKCMIEPPPCPDGTPGTERPDDALEKMIKDDKLCKEHGLVKAPGFAGGREYYAVTYYENGPGEMGTTSGAPGINIHDRALPKPKRDGDYSHDCSDGSTKTFSAGDVAKLAAILLHELSHYKRSDDHGENSCEDEKAAYKYEIEQLCKVVNCDAWELEGVDMDAVKKKICERIKEANLKMCEECEDAEEKPDIIPCDACAALGVELPEKCPCPEDDDDEEGPAGGPALTDYAEDPRGDEIRGTVQLFPGARQMEFFTAGDNYANSFSLDFELEGQADFQPLSFCQPVPGQVLVAGYDVVQGDGRIVLVVYSASGGQVILVQTVFQGPQFSNPQSIAFSPFDPRKVTLFDAWNFELVQVELSRSVAWTLATGNDFPFLYDETIEVSHFPLEVGPGFEIHAYLVSIPDPCWWCLPLWDTAMPRHPYEVHFLWDYDGDGRIDGLD